MWPSLPCAVLLKHMVRSGGRCAAWLAPGKGPTGELEDLEASIGGGQEGYDVSDSDHREFVSAGVAAGIAVRTRKAPH